MWNAEAVAETLVDDGLLRRRPSGYFPTLASIRIRRWTFAAPRGARSRSWRPARQAAWQRGCRPAPASVHPGAVYLHQGESYVVDSLDFEDGIAFVHSEDPGYTTFARELTDIAVDRPG